MVEGDQSFDGLALIISQKTGTVIENTIKESFLVDSTGKAIQEDMEAIILEEDPVKVAALAKNVVRTFNLLEERQKCKTGERLRMLQEGMDISLQALKNLDRMTVDKSVLEFEIKLLERLVITSELVKDWRERVKEILNGLDQAIEVRFLFTLFQVDGEGGKLEIFWTRSPEEGTRAMVEKIVRAKLPPLKEASGQAVHHVARPEGGSLELDQNNLLLPAKTITLEEPYLSGIVGMGVEVTSEESRVKDLVVESVLTTLLNVVGSVKAIGKYTRDLEYYATRDPLTKLYNQRVFGDLLSYEVSRSKRHGHDFSVLMIDADNFKAINDTYGHAVGDRFLREFADCLRASARQEDIVARYGGDEFTAILPDTNLEESYLVAKRMVESLKDFFIVTDNEAVVKTTVSVGIASFPRHATEANDLFLIADNMLYRSKNLGKNRISIPAHEDGVEVFRRSGEKHLLVRQALEENLVVPYFQPIVDAGTGVVAAYEVLMRLNLPSQVMEAGEFIGIAEKSGLISKLDDLLRGKAMAKLRDSGFQGHLFINLSPRALLLQEFIVNVLALVRANRLEPKQIVFEITERETVQSYALLEKFVQDLKTEGFKFAIDDFGSGFSSFSYLKRFPVDFVKVDGEFIKGMVGEGGKVDRSIVNSIATLASGLGAKTIGEYVENEEILRALRGAGIDYAQGYHTGRPEPEIGR